MSPSGDARLERLRDVERRKSMRGRRTISQSHVVEGTWVVNDSTDIRCRRGRVLLRLSVKSDAKLHPVELRRSSYFEICTNETEFSCTLGRVRTEICCV